MADSEQISIFDDETGQGLFVDDLAHGGLVADTSAAAPQDEPEALVALPLSIQEAPEVIIIHCRRCGQDAARDHRSPHLCQACAKAENSRVTYYRQHQDDWLAVARESGIDLWLQQPGETQWEYTVWTAYRDSYPGKKPSYGSVAEQLSTTYESVKKIAARWVFQTRMQAWMAECDRITMLQRREEILTMNKAHVDMAATLREKLATAIELIVPERLKPGEIASLARLSADMERKARIDTVAQEEMRRELVSDAGNPELKKSQTKQGDLSEVVQILLKAGALGDITQIGVRETTTKTTEVALVDKQGQSASLEMDGEEDV